MSREERFYDHLRDLINEEAGNKLRNINYLMFLVAELDDEYLLERLTIAYERVEENGDIDLLEEKELLDHAIVEAVYDVLYELPGDIYFYELNLLLEHLTNLSSAAHPNAVSAEFADTYFPDESSKLYTVFGDEELDFLGESFSNSISNTHPVFNAIDQRLIALAKDGGFVT